MKLLQALLLLIFPERKNEARVRETSPEEVLSHLYPAPLSIRDGIALLPFRVPCIRALITEAKFHGNTRAQELLGTVVTEYLRDALPDVLAFEARPVFLIPIPLSKQRYKERGYNQVEAIAQHASKTLSFPLITHLLKRTRHTAAQTSLGKDARLSNMKNAFAAKDLDPSPLYIVIDDVSTTGATLSAAVQALTEAGATRVLPLAIAH